MTERKITSPVICWDLDDTLGSFGWSCQDQDQERTPSALLRYGVADLLRNFSEESGYLQAVTTGATLQRANDVLEKTGLLHHFEWVFGRETVGILGKRYRPVVETLGLSDEDMRANMIVIGDSSLDEPMDTDLVFLHVNSLNMEALVICKIVTTLLEKGEGHFRNGFEMLYQEATPTVENEKKLPQWRTYQLGDSIAFELGYKKMAFPSNDGIESPVPTITGIKAPRYIRDPQPF